MRSRVLLAAAMALGALSVAPVERGAVQSLAMSAPRLMPGSGSGPSRLRRATYKRRGGESMTAAQQQRASRKRRNQQRHKRARGMRA